MNTAANDTTETTTILRGTTLESRAWRAHRFANLIRVTSLVNASKRGKVCEEFSVVVSGHGSDDEQLDSIAPSIAWAVQGDVSVESMRALLRDTELAGFTFREASPRGVDVPRGKVVVVDDLVDVTFTDVDFHGRFTAIHSTRPLEERIARGLEMLDRGADPQEAAAHVARASFRQDTLVGCRSRKDAAKAYQWAQSPENRKRLVSMTLTDFRREMDAIGVSVS